VNLVDVHGAERARGDDRQDIEQHQRPRDQRTGVLEPALREVRHKGRGQQQVDRVEARDPEQAAREDRSGGNRQQPHQQDRADAVVEQHRDRRGAGDADVQRLHFLRSERIAARHRAHQQHEAGDQPHMPAQPLSRVGHRHRCHGQDPPLF
jgi:hypothetical protein